jgi:probable rRNA maturation factor
LNRRAPNGPSCLFWCGLVIFRKSVAGLSEPALSRFVSRASRAAKLRGDVSVLITTSHELRALNRRFRKQDKATDVLSFPPMFLNGQFAGDIAISADVAARQAKQLGHSPAEEVKTLALHGVLHLAGYDHDVDDGRMARLERRLRKRLGLPSGLIERVHKSGASGRPAGGRKR